VVAGEEDLIKDNLNPLVAFKNLYLPNLESKIFNIIINKL
jgi:hypothetical protein